MRNIGEFLGDAWRLAKPYFTRSEERRSAWLLLITVIAMQMLLVGMSVVLNFWNNAFFTSLKGMSRDQMRDAVVAYGQSNPQVQNEIQAIRQPANDFRDRCQAPVPDGMPGS